MPLVQIIYRALVVSTSEKFMKEIGSLLEERTFETEYAENAGEARRRLHERTYDFVIVNAPLRDEYGTRLCIDSSVNSGTIAVIFAASDIYEEITQKTAHHGVFIIRKPSSQQTIRQAVSLLISAREKIRAIEKKAGKAENKLEEIRIVNKAKWFLIDNEDMNENEAHKYIEKLAMDSGITKQQAAQIIIDRY
ncbi:MAG: ANTAR domain-containing protein [Ruminococcus sp.]|nr:ANTAR domain-containing protein [Ruminococcus sp.]